MLRMPSRNPRYLAGKSTPHSIRINDALWADFMTMCRDHGIDAATGVKLVMERSVVVDRRMRRRKRLTEQADRDQVITVDIG